MNPIERAQFLLSRYSFDKAQDIINSIIFDATIENNTKDIKYWTEVKKSLSTLATNNEVEQ